MIVWGTDGTSSSGVWVVDIVIYPYSLEGISRVTVASPTIQKIADMVPGFCRNKGGITKMRVELLVTNVKFA